VIGVIAQAHYGGVPPHIAGPALDRLDDRLRKIAVRFTERHRAG